MAKNTKDEISAKRLLPLDDSAFPSCSVNTSSSDSKHELNHTRGIPTFTSHFDETLYVSGRMTARNRSMAMVTMLKIEE